MENQEEMVLMLILIHGIDKGHALLTTIIFIMVLSILSIALIPLISGTKIYAQQLKLHVLETIDQHNQAVSYDLY